MMTEQAHNDHDLPPAGTMTVVTDVADTVASQANSTVSTTALRAEGARLVVFAFDTGQELSEHTAAVPVLLQVLSGRLSVTAAGRTVEIRPADVVHLTSRLPHSVVALEPTRLLLALLDPRNSPVVGQG